MKQRLLPITLLVLLATLSLHADNHNTYPLPENRGTSGILAALRKTPVYARVLNVTAHPDDENAGTLTWLARKAHARVALFSLTRGDGGQNLLGDEKYEAMGLVRTGELLEACRLYGAEPFFSTVFEFGFSKSAEETLAKWGHEATLEEVVRFIRSWRPTIMISQFRSGGGDGHGHHQAAGILAHEAFRAAGDPQRFPEHLKQGLAPWQAKKLYQSGGRGGASGGATLSIPSGDFDPVLGRSYREIGAEGYSKHRTQGSGANSALPGRSYDYYQLVDSTAGRKAQETSFFDSIDTSLASILELAGSDRTKVAFLEADLAAAQKAADAAVRAFQPAHPSGSAVEAAKGVASLNEAIRKLDAASLPQPAKGMLLAALGEKLEDFQKAVNASLGVYLIARAEEAAAIPGQSIPIVAYFYNRGSEPVDLKEIKLQIREGWIAQAASGSRQDRIAAGESTTLRFNTKIAENARVTEPFWYRESPGDNRYKTRPTPNVFAPFNPPEVTARADYRFRETGISISSPVMASAGDPLRGADFVDFQVVPALSVTIKPALAVIPISPSAQAREFQVSILSNDKAGARGAVRLILPAGWQSDPGESSFAVSRKGESFTARFALRIPAGTPPGNFHVDAVASTAGREYRQGYRVISYPENWTRHLYSPSRAEVEVFDVKVAPRLTVGYVPGAGDEVPAALEQLDVKVEMLSSNDLAFGDLSRFGAIVTGIRAYNVNEDLRANNQRLLKYVAQGGTLILQYVRPLGRSFGGAPFPYGPYPMSNSDADRITVEESPLELLDPQHPVFTTPNKIAMADFNGWVQERGLYFMSQWDPRYTALLAGHDPGEEPKKGGMLITRYGKGYWIYTAYAWFRQLPAGVPGAFRIFANMLSLGK